MFKRIAAMMLAGALTLSMAACGSSTPVKQDATQVATEATTEAASEVKPAVDTNAKVELRMITHFTDEARRDLLNQAVEQLKKKWPKVEIADETTTEYATKMKLEFSSGNGPDFVTVDDLYQQTLMVGNYLKDITDIVEQGGFIEKSVPGAVEFNNMRTPGKYYSIPFLMAPVVVYYNKDVFTKLGISAPTTMEEFEAAMDKAKQGGFMPMAIAGSSNMNTLWLTYHMVFNNSKIADIREWYYQKSTPDSVKTGFTDAFKKIDEWTKKGYFGDPKIAMGISYDNYVANMYAKGDVAMIMDGDWNIAAFQDSGVNTGVFAFPSDYIVNATDSGWALNAQADDTRKAVFADFVNVFFSQDMIGKYYAAGYTPSVKFDTNGLDVTPLRVELQNAAAPKKLGYFLDNAVPGLFDLATKATQDLMLGKLTPEQCWEQLNTGYEKSKAESAGK